MSRKLYTYLEVVRGASEYDVGHETLTGVMDNFLV